MSASAILTVVGSDRPGLTQAIADAVAAAGGNWLESHLASMGGMFVGSIHVEVAGSDLSQLEAKLGAIDPTGLRVTVMPVAPVARFGQSEGQELFLDLVGQDRPGIVQEVTTALAALKVNISTFESSVESSSWSGERLFRATAELTLPPDVDEFQVREALEQLSGEIMVDLDAIEDELAGPRPDPIPSSTRP
jgi:glycine cleavage system regulatory protein